MVVLGAPEGLGGFDLGDNPLGFEFAFGGELVDLGVGLRLLLRRMEEDGGAVLRAPVRALAVEGGRVVEIEKRVQQLLEADLLGIEIEFDDLGVAGLVGADVLVGWATAVAVTPGMAANAASTPQKQPAPKVAFSMVMVDEMRRWRIR